MVEGPPYRGSTSGESRLTRAEYTHNQSHLQITAITSVLSFVNGYTLMGGTELVYNLFAMCLPGSPNTHAGLCVLDPGKQTFSVMRMIAVALVVKAALTVVTFGIKVPAGIFIPTLGVGACAGRIVGLAVQYARWRWPTAAVFSSCGETGQCVIPGLYAMVGAAATLSGVTRTTVSLAVIMFELTDTLTYTMPVMLGVLVAKTVADSLEPKGIYELVIEYADLSVYSLMFLFKEKFQARATPVPERETPICMGRQYHQRCRTSENFSPRRLTIAF